MSIYRVILSNAAQHAPITEYVEANDRTQALNHVLYTLGKVASDYAVILVTPLDAIKKTATPCNMCNVHEFVFDNDQLQSYDIKEVKTSEMHCVQLVNPDTGEMEYVNIMLSSKIMNYIRNSFLETSK